MVLPGKDVCARCPAAGSIRQALNRAVQLVVRDWSLDLSCQRHFRGRTCSALRAELRDRKASLLEGLEESSYRSLQQALKSCDRFFDIPCSPCDKRDGSKALADWQRKVAQPVDFLPSAPTAWSSDPVREVVQRVRDIVGSGWAEDIARYRAANLVPDQNGCLETPQGEGGTLATAEKDYSPDPFLLRVGIAKTKGKFRVVTMQSAKVKEVLRPVHECLYDFISRRGWLVRGDVTEEHVRSVASDVREGEMVISGDYEAATNNIYTPVVYAIVECLAESPYLSLEEKELLKGSFLPENLRWVSRKGKTFPILRGSMMGNLLSFPILCLLNRACWGLADSLRRKRVGGGRRSLLVNGDDIAFAGDRQFYEDWRMVTSQFGLVVNESKTGMSPKYLELNSRSFEIRRGRRIFIRPLRKPVLSALMPGDQPGCLLTRLWEGLRTLSPGSFRMAVVWLRHDIAARGITLGSLPTRLRRVLVKEKWARHALLVKPCVLPQTVSSCTGNPVLNRCWPEVLRDVAPPDHLLPLYEKLKRDCLRRGVSYVRGIKCTPYREVLCRCTVRRERRNRPGIFTFRTRWHWRWMGPVWSWWERQGLPLRPLGNSLWMDDHPDLSSGVEVIVSHGFGPPPSLLSGVNVDGFVLWPNGFE
jgi:hypothetical protein